MNKRYIYKAYEEDGTFIGTIPLVSNTPDFASSINGGYGQMVMTLPKSMFEFDEGNTIQQGNRIDLICYYEGPDDDGAETEVKVFSGFISKYAPSLSREKEEVIVTVLGSITQLERYILEFPESESEKCLELIGSSSQYARKTSPTGLTITGDITLECWTRISALGASDMYLINKGDTTEDESGNILFSVDIQTDGKLRWFHEYGSGSNEFAISTETIIKSTDLDEWVHLAVVRDTTANTISFYKNGIFLESVSYTNEATGGSTGNLTIGGNNAATPGGLFTGRIADVRIWNDKRTEKELGGNLYKHLLGTESNLQGYWKLDNDYTDETANSNDLTAGGSPSFSTSVFGGGTTIAYYWMSPGDMIKDILNKFNALGGVPTYNATSIEDTGTTETYSINTLTVAEALKKCVELSPAGWYYFVDSENVLHFKNKSTTADHLIILQKDIVSIQQEKSSENMVNKIYFTGGEVTGSPLYRKYIRSSSISSYGVYAIKKVDTRVTLAATMDTMAGAILDRKDSPETRTIMILRGYATSWAGDLGVEIENIHPGDTIKTIGLNSKLTNKWDEAVWNVDVWDYEQSEVLSIVQQIRKVSYKPDTIEIEISTRLPDVARSVKILEERVTKQNTNENPENPTTA